MKVGDPVSTGQALGIVGSSGCSTAPHLHFEVHDCDDAVVEPAKAGMWLTDAATYEVSGIVDVMLRVGGSGMSSEYIKSPSPNPTSMKKTETMYVGFSAALRPGDEVTSRMFPVNGAPEMTRSGHWTVPPGRFGQRWGYWNNYQFNGYTGPVLLSFFVNGQVKALRGFMVTAP